MHPKRELAVLGDLRLDPVSLRDGLADAGHGFELCRCRNSRLGSRWGHGCVRRNRRSRMRCLLGDYGSRKGQPESNQRRCQQSHENPSLWALVRRGDTRGGTVTIAAYTRGFRQSQAVRRVFLLRLLTSVVT